MSHQMKRTNRIELPSHEDIYVRHLRSRLPPHEIFIPRSVDLNFLLRQATQASHRAER